ncbi:MAG: hybrid sensor histidine kinase/response regulator [Bacteriovoracaceae bacterium]|nr:hybrid sensor histidine kinase/response regulator [Bacteriovoracaceae bacterium]
MKFNILFIDDEKDILAAYQRLLESNSKKSKLDDLLGELTDDIPEEKKFTHEDQYNFFQASQGQDGIDIVKKQLELKDPISLCFVDFRMPPGLNGKDTIKAIRQIDKNIEIVLVTAYSDINLEDIVQEVGTPEKLLFLKKPFDNKEVSQLILNLTRKYFDARVRENFVSSVTHELKTPLASILGFSQLLLEEELSEDQRDFIGTILDSAILMKEQVDDLLSVAHIERTGLKLNKNTVSVLEITNEVSQMMQPLFKNGPLDFKVECPEDFSINVDKNKFKQCLINLITNARKFTHAGFVKLNVKKDIQGFSFEVEDSGIGISQEKIEKVFDRFFRVEDEHHNTPGLGLGLAIVKNILDAHELKIHVESQLGKGSKFVIKSINHEELKEVA